MSDHAAYDQGYRDGLRMAREGVDVAMYLRGLRQGANDVPSEPTPFASYEHCQACHGRIGWDQVAGWLHWYEDRPEDGHDAAPDADLAANYPLSYVERAK